MKCDLHVHTSYSYDSSSSPKEMVEAALSKDINCLAITDHNEIMGALEAMEFARGKPILIIPGIEIKSKAGDILGLGITTLIPAGLSPEETIKEVKKAGGRVFIPHPFGFNCAFKEDLIKFIKMIDGIEVLNSSLFGGGNKKALAFAKKYNLPLSAGSDAHSPEFLGSAYLEISGNNLSIETIFEKIKNREVKVRGKEVNFFEKVVDHSRRNLIRIKNYAG